VGILDQISILRSPATADLKQNQYSTKMVQLVGRGLLRFTTLLSGACGFALAVCSAWGCEAVKSLDSKLLAN